jgi:hypothetical protein
MPSILQRYEGKLFTDFMKRLDMRFISKWILFTFMCIYVSSFLELEYAKIRSQPWL